MGKKVIKNQEARPAYSRRLSERGEGGGGGAASFVFSKNIIFNGGKEGES